MAKKDTPGVIHRVADKCFFDWDSIWIAGIFLECVAMGAGFFFFLFIFHEVPKLG